MNSVTKRVIHRNSEDGRIVTKEYAKTHPKTTEREVVKLPPRSPPAKKQ